MTVLLVAAVLGGGCAGPDGSGTGGDPARRADRLGRVLAKHPERYPVRVSLAEALLDEATRTLDPDPVARARDELRRSLATQESYEAFVMMARVENFAHRFPEALRWTDRAAAASPAGDEAPDLRLLRFEALLGLGRTNEARALLAGMEAAERSSDGGRSFAALAMRGRLLAGAGRLSEAGDAFARAAASATGLGRDDLAGWAWIQCAGARLDGGDLAGAQPALEAASRSLPDDEVSLAVHRAEWHEARGDWARSRRIVRSALEGTGHPLLHQHAWRAARKLGRKREAERHFAAAERGFRRAVDAGEAYTVDALSRLLLEAATTADSPGAAAPPD